MTEELRGAILALRSEGLSTPEICQRLELDSEIVIRLLMQETIGPSRVQRVPVVSPVRAVGRPRKLVESELMVTMAQVIAAGNSKRASLLWTFPDLLEALRGVTEPRLSGDTLRRYLNQQGLTFDHQLVKVAGSAAVPEVVADVVQSYRALLYVVTHRTTVGDEASHSATTLLVGVSASNRLALFGRHQSRLSPGMLSEFFRDLLALHPGRHIVALTSGEGIYRRLVNDAFLNQQSKLHLYLLRGRQKAKKLWSDLKEFDS